MKTIFYIFLLLMFGHATAIAQKPIVLTDDEVKFGNTMCPGVWVEIPEVSSEVVKSNWKKAIEKGSKSKALVTGNEITIFGAIYKDVTELPVNIFSSVAEKDSIVRLFASVELSRDVFTKTGSAEHDQLKKTLKQFAKDQYVKVAKDQLSAQESTLKNMEKDLASLRKEKEKLEKEIQNANTSISQETYKIATAEKEISTTNSTLESRTSEVNQMPDGKEKKSAESELKSLEKKVKDLQKSNVTSESRITKSNTVIEENTAAIALNETNQEELGVKINKQKMQVANYTDKLATIESY
jgi:predicted  nucleic acid-binding Zn-ribbon protein